MQTNNRKTSKHTESRAERKSLRGRRNRKPRSRSRSGALRAAKAATLGLAMLGCHASNFEMAEQETGADVDAGAEVGTADAILEAEPADSGPDGSLDAIAFDTSDASNADVGDAAADASPCEELTGTEAFWDCCEDHAWNVPGCFAWGPFVPPSVGAVPASRPIILAMSHRVDRASESV